MVIIVIKIIVSYYLYFVKFIVLVDKI